MHRLSSGGGAYCGSCGSTRAAGLVVRASSALLSVLVLATGCSDGATAPRGPADAISLGLGQTRVVTMDTAAPIHVAGGQSGAEYTLVAFASPNGPVIPLQVSAEGVAEVVGPPTPNRMPPTGSPPSAATPTWARMNLELPLREDERQHLSSLVEAARRVRASVARSSEVVPAVGDEMSLNVSLDACGPPTLHTARVMNVSDHALFVEDETNPAGGFTADDYQSIADEYETLVYPVLTDNFGTSSDIDDNGGRTIVLFTRAVNEMTAPGASAYISGFFYLRDLVSRSGSSPCAGSNEAELLYQMVPDPGGVINGQVWQAPAVREQVGGALAHEGQFLVNQSRRLYVTRAPIEVPWLDEAMSNIAEELVFYRASGLAPRRNLSLSDVKATGATVSAADRYQILNLVRLQSYLGGPESHPIRSAMDDFAASGAAWQFLRYLADRSGVPERTLWSSLVNSSAVGTGNLATATGLDVAAAEHDWAVAQYTDDAGFPVDATLLQPSWNFRSVLEGMSNHLGFALATHPLTAATPLSLTLQRGGASYLRFAVARGQYASIRVTPDQQAMGKYLSLTLVRTR